MVRIEAARRARRCAAHWALMLAGLVAAATATGQDKPIAEARSLDGKVKVELLSLKRIEGNLITLRWQFNGDSSMDYSMVPGNTRLIDLTNRREYSPGLTASLCRSKGGERGHCWATFAGPPAGTRTMAVKFYEQFDLLLGVPVTD